MRKFPHGPHDGPKTSTYRMERERDEAITRRLELKTEADLAAAGQAAGQARLRAAIETRVRSLRKSHTPSS